MRDGTPAIVPHEAAKRVCIETGLDRRRPHTSDYDMTVGLSPSSGERVNMFGGNPCARDAQPGK
jgi:Xaa-Pro dipeptidase